MRLPVLLTAVLALAPLHAEPGITTGEPWQIVPQRQSSLVFARDGAFIGEIGTESRTTVPIRSLPRYVGQAFVAVEDQRFYQHDGVDLIGVAGAIKGRILGSITGEKRGGASTITQQLVGNMHPDQIDRRDMSLARKLREQQAAREMERHYSKEQILEAYINQINFGHGWYGVESASRHYFAKSASTLTLAEAATLAALPKSPVAYDPARFPDRARTRRDLILGLMAAQGFVSATAAGRARTEPVTTAPNSGAAAPSEYFVDAARQFAERAGVNVAGGGYRIYTTEDPALERAAVQSLTEGTLAVERRPDFRHRTWASATGAGPLLGGAVVAMAHRAGIPTLVAAVAASALGASVVRPLDYVAAYALWANSGGTVEPRIVTRIEDATGRVVYQRPPSVPQQVMDARIAFIVRDMMRDAAERGTGTAARKTVPPEIAVAGKTGTTNDNVDVWFMVMTPNLVAGVCLAFDC